MSEKIVELEVLNPRGKIKPYRLPLHHPAYLIWMERQ